jgi:signal transduction histidine kinase
MSSIHQEQGGSGMEAGADAPGESGHDGSPQSLALRIEALERALAHERRARAIATDANRAKDEFLSVVSHELRSPLNAILGWNRILAIKRAHDAEVGAITSRIEQSARAQLKMVNDLLDFGRIGTGKLRVTPRPVKLSTLAAMAVDAARPAAEGKSLMLTLQPGPAGAVMGDPDRLMQVISNLLSNSIKFTPRGGRIAVRLRDGGENVHLSVVDSGQGIEAQLLSHVFDRFTQGDSSTTRAGGWEAALRSCGKSWRYGGTVCALSDGSGRGDVPQ